MVGTYAVTILDELEQPIDTFDRTTRVGIPRTGEEVELDGRLCVVIKVRHEAEDDRTVRRYTRARIFVRPLRPRLVLP